MTNASPLTLVVNCGSSSLKFALFGGVHSEALMSGLAERLGSPEARMRFDLGGARTKIPLANGGHQQALETLLGYIDEHGWLGRIGAVGHRVVHGGERFTRSVEIDADVISDIEACCVLAPLHNPANLIGVRAALAALPEARQVAVFDTAFHQTMPPEAYHYALPQNYHRAFGVRRYGFHGTSHRFVAQRAMAFLGLDESRSGLIVLHLGNGASATAIRNGASVDTSMGLTPVEGLVMGTRCGDVDAGALLYIARRANLDLDGLDKLVNKESGLLGLSELSNDCRTLEAAAQDGHEGARLALDVFTYRIAKTVGGLATALPHLDAVVFTGGIGENSTGVRAAVLNRLGSLGMTLDVDLNNAISGGVTGIVSGSRHPCALVVPTDEERMIACDTAAIVYGEQPVAYSSFAQAAQ